MNTVRREWDRIAIYVLLLAFGVHTMMIPLTSVRQSSPTWAAWMLGIEFVAAGFLLMIGLTKPMYRMAGLVITTIGLTTISLLIGTGGNERALGVAFLFGAFALQGVHDLRQEHARRAEAKKLRRELEQLLNGDGQ